MMAACSNVGRAGIHTAAPLAAISACVAGEPREAWGGLGYVSGGQATHQAAKRSSLQPGRMKPRVGRGRQVIMEVGVIGSAPDRAGLQDRSKVADHIVENRTYLVALASENSPETQPFDKEAVTAAQCMAAFAMSPLPDGADGTLVALSQHINPNVGAVAALSFLWISEGERWVNLRGHRRPRGERHGKQLPIEQVSWPCR